MTTFASPLMTKIAPETSVAPFTVGGLYTVTVANGKNGLVLTATTSNTVQALVIPAGRMITSYGIAVYEAFTGPASTRMDLLVGSTVLKGNQPVTAVVANVTPDSGGGSVLYRPFTVDTTVSYFVSCSSGVVPTAGKAIIALGIG